MGHLSYGVTKNRKIYGNCQVLSPNNILMFRCDEKKANWYIKRNLGDIVSYDPLIIKLNFKPKGLGNHNKDWGLSEMLNKCVVCGEKEFLTKHHVVPSFYRRYFPLEVKSHKFHDILSVCVDCHERYERHADELKLEISIKYDAPINGEVEKRKDVVKYIKMAFTLLRNDINIPKERIKELRGEIKNFFGIKRLTNAKLKSIVSNKPILVRKTHGEMVVQKLENLQDFVEMWRHHFVDKMKPKFLPKNWRIKNNIYE